MLRPMSAIVWVACAAPWSDEVEWWRSWKRLRARCHCRCHCCCCLLLLLLLLHRLAGC